jgi:hypothetical protein
MRADSGIAQHQRQVAQGLKPARAMGAIEQDIAKNVSLKLNQPLYRVNIRAYVAGGDAASKANGLRKSFNVYRTQYQAVMKRPEWGLLVRYRQYLTLHRLPVIRLDTTSILSASEVASVYHFPA